MRSLTPDGDATAARMDAWLVDLSKLVEQVRAGSHDPEVVHDVRVVIRRLRSTTRLIAEACGARVKGLAGLDRTLKRIARETGPVRDADVLDENLVELRQQEIAATAPWKGALAVLAADVDARRREGWRAVQQVLAEPDHQAQLAKAPQVAARAAALSPPASQLARILAERLEDMVAHVELARRAQDPEEWHRVRIAIKRVRYAVELLAGRDSPLVEGFVKLQSALGKAHDHRVWQERALALRKKLSHRGLDVAARGGLAEIAQREGDLAAQHEHRAAAEFDLLLGPELRARLLAEFSGAPVPARQQDAEEAPRWTAP